MHDAFTIGIPVLAILAGILFNRSDMKELGAELKGDVKGMRGEMKEVRAEMKELRIEMNRRFDGVNTEMNRRFDAVDAELRYFHGTIGKLDGRVQSLEGRS